MRMAAAGGVRRLELRMMIEISEILGYSVLVCHVDLDASEVNVSESLF